MCFNLYSLLQGKNDPLLVISNKRQQLPQVKIYYKFYSYCEKAQWGLKPTCAISKKQKTQQYQPKLQRIIEDYRISKLQEMLLKELQDNRQMVLKMDQGLSLVELQMLGMMHSCAFGCTKMQQI